MKNFKYFFMIAAATLMFASCNKGYNFEKVVATDVNSIAETYPDAVFYESRVVLSDTLDTAVSKLYVDEITNVFQSNDTVIVLDHPKGGKKNDVSVTILTPEYILEDGPIQYPVVFTLTEAIKIARSGEATTPHSDKVTLRRPFGPNPNSNPQYIFGSSTDSTYAFVNANTGYVSNTYDYERVAGESEMVSDWITNLDHDIHISGVSCIEDGQHTGFDTWVGPTGWPWTDKVMWETALYEDKDFYYARLIYHEYMFWWSWDYPYIVVKFPKCNVDGDLRTNEKLRYEVLWKITYTTERSYSYGPYITDPKVRHINGHTVSFGNYACKYEKYYVISDSKYDW